MKKLFFLFTLLAMATFFAQAQKLDWYSYWGSNEAGCEVIPVKTLVDKNENIYVVGTIKGTVNIVGENITANSSSQDVILVKMDKNKQVLWYKTLVESGSASVSDMEFDRDGNLVLIGTFTVKIKIDNMSMEFNNLTGYMTGAGYIAKIATDGSPLQMLQLGAEPGLGMNDICIDQDNNMIISGIFSSELCFDLENPSEGNVEGNTDMVNQLFVVKYTSSGTPIWKKYTQTGNGSIYNAVCDVDTKGNVYIGGTFNGKIDFSGSITVDIGVSSADSRNMFILKCDANDGNYLWANKIGGSCTDGPDELSGIAVNKFGEVGVSGSFVSRDITVGSEILVPAIFPKKKAVSRALAVGLNGENGNMLWYYHHGDRKQDGAGAILLRNIICTDEGIWYIMGNASLDIGDRTSNPNGDNLPALIENGVSSITLVDGSKIFNSGNGGADALFMALNREGKAMQYARMGMAQTERLTSIALNADKSAIYFLYNILSRGGALVESSVANPFFCVHPTYGDGNFEGDKFVVYGPEKVDGKFLDGKGNHNSTIIARYTLPTISPLSDYTSNTLYSQKLTFGASVNETPEITLLKAPEGLVWDKTNSILSGTLSGTREYDIESIITARANTTLTAYRGDNKAVRYLSLKETNTNNESINIETKQSVFYPTCFTNELYIQTDMDNFEVKIYSETGILVENIKNVKCIQLNHLPAGTYIAEFNVGIQYTHRSVIFKQ